MQLEKQLQWREIIKKAAVVQEATKREEKILPKAAKPKVFTISSWPSQRLCHDGLVVAKEP